MQKVAFSPCSVPLSLKELCLIQEINHTSIYRQAMVRLCILSMLIAAAAGLNVLYIVSDDMRPEWGIYNGSAITPNLDELARSSLLFRRSYCQISVCSPSRQSFMSSRRPNTYDVWNFIDAVPTTITSLPRVFRDNGYLTLGLGKLWHEDSGAWNANNSWSPELPYYPYQAGKCPHGGQGGGHCVQKDEQIYDWHLLNNTLSYMDYAIQSRLSTGRPFFLASGYRKPHAPWQAPQRMYDLYNQSALHTADPDTFSTTTPLVAWSGELSVKLENGTTFPFSPFKAVPRWVQQDQRHAYYASVSYVDEHVGAMLSKLDAAGLRNETIIVVHADHGYLLSEHGYWEKKSNFENTVRVPTMIHVPNATASHGQVTDSLFELVDMMPTVVSLAGLTVPSGLDGMDQSALLSEPHTGLKEYAFHQYPACGKLPNFNSTRAECNQVPKQQFKAMGYTVRDASWRYTRWLWWNATKLNGEWDGEYAEELYDHAGDLGAPFDRFENENVAAAHQDLCQQYTAVLRKHFET
eukprot:m.181905 g.181905  ORF g.181905 m.181905 type:complete len:521 (-) comp16876_c0_seq4:2581-4143(-)